MTKWSNFSDKTDIFDLLTVLLEIAERENALLVEIMIREEDGNIRSLKAINMTTINHEKKLVLS